MKAAVLYDINTPLQIEQFRVFIDLGKNPTLRI